MASSLDADRTRALAPVGSRTGAFTVPIGDEIYIGRVQPLGPPGASGAPVALVLRSRTEHLRFLPHLHWQIALTGLAAVLIATIAGYLVARTVTRLVELRPDILVETLLGDFGGHFDYVDTTVDAKPHVWAHNIEAMGRLDQGDIEEAIRTASAIGDDKLQKAAQGVVGPDSFTHGSSAQRTKWFNTGFQSGSMQSCDTFRNQV